MTLEQTTLQNIEPLSEPGTDKDIEESIKDTPFADTVLLILKPGAQGGPIQLEVFGNVNTARIAKSGGIHEAVNTRGRKMVFDGHDVLWSEVITADEHRKAHIAKVKAETLAAEQKAAREKAEAESAAKAQAEVATKPKGLLGRFRGRSR